MTVLTIKRTEKLYGGPLTSLLIEGTAALHAAYPGETGTPDWDCKALYAECDGEIVGCICWKVTAWLQQAFIVFGYVKPERRRLGIYRRLYDALEAEAVTLRLRSIIGYTSVDNTALQIAARRQGREPVSIGFIKRLRVEDEVVS